MRYNVNQQYPFIAILFERKNGKKETQGLGGTFFPWEHKLISIHLELLTCAEHHKVPNAYDESKPPVLDCDGFIFTNPSTNETWHNQYPSASYGQLTDTANYLVTVDCDREVVESQWETRVFQMEDGLYRLAQVHRGIFQLQNELEKVKANPHEFRYSYEEMQANVELLKEFAARLSGEMVKLTGKEIVVDPVSYGPHRKVIEGHYKCRFADEADESNLTVK